MLTRRYMISAHVRRASWLASHILTFDISVVMWSAFVGGVGSGKLPHVFKTHLCEVLHFPHISPALLLWSLRCANLKNRSVRHAKKTVWRMITKTLSAWTTCRKYICNARTVRLIHHAPERHTHAFQRGLFQISGSSNVDMKAHTVQFHPVLCQNHKDAIHISVRAHELRKYQTKHNADVILCVLFVPYAWPLFRRDRRYAEYDVKVMHCR